MQGITLAIIAVLCNVSAQVLMKFAGKLDLKIWSNWFSLYLIAAVICYGLSFLLTVKVFSQNALSIASPLMAGATFVLIALASMALFSEAFTWQKAAGMALIALGIFLLSRV